MSARRFRKRPVEVEADRWDGTAKGATPIIDWILGHGGTARFHEAREEFRNVLGDGTVQGCTAEPSHIAIDTLEGTIHASDGDWIIRGVAGEFYPCKPDIFERIYEPVDA